MRVGYFLSFPKGAKVKNVRLVKLIEQARQIIQGVESECEKGTEVDKSVSDSVATLLRRVDGELYTAEENLSGFDIVGH